MTESAAARRAAATAALLAEGASVQRDFAVKAEHLLVAHRHSTAGDLPVHIAIPGGYFTVRFREGEVYPCKTNHPAGHGACTLYWSYVSEDRLVAFHLPEDGSDAIFYVTDRQRRFHLAVDPDPALNQLIARNATKDEAAWHFGDGTRG
ncbi:hypothetical protein JNJ66_05885 [Candidatus Saccharibacteria bacterium]|nr:hypothetical protein [Candidatus Saccharibacteria bacterium]